MTPSERSLRVALVVGTLARGGAEKQLVYVASALRRPGVEIRVYALTHGEYYEASLVARGMAPEWIGRRHPPIVRLATLVASLRRFRPHVVQSSHFFANLYVGLAARLLGALGLGAVRNDGDYEVNGYRIWGRGLLALPDVLVTNSYAAQRNVQRMGMQSAKVHVLPNVLDRGEFDALAAQGGEVERDTGQPVAVVVARHSPEKRLALFLEALSIARGRGSGLRGVLIGDGPERSTLEKKAGALELLPHAVRFLGLRDDVPACLRRADMLVLTSRHEGFPNVLLEAMAARLPVVTTPAGDAGVVVRDAETGFVVPFDDVETLAGRMIQLASMPGLRRQMGEAGRRRVEVHYGPEGLFERLLDIYRASARQPQTIRLLAQLR